MKANLIHQIEVKHRQLERYLFYFQKSREGAFTATERPKFAPVEMVTPGVVGE
jgi:hypothetical protein